VKTAVGGAPLWAPLTQRGSPPSTYAILSALENEPGSAQRVAWSTARRMVLIAPALWIAGFRGRDLVRASVASTLGITLGLMGYYSHRRKNGRPVT
jgi:hypothetical protein